MNRLCQFLAEPPSGFSRAAHRHALRRFLLLVAAAAAFFGALPLMAPHPAQSAEIFSTPTAAIAAERPAQRAPEKRQARRKSVFAGAAAVLQPEPRS